MTMHQTIDLTGDEATFIRRLNAAYGVGPMEPAARVAFDQRLEERLTRPRQLRSPLLVATTAMAAVFLWVALPRPGSVARTPQATVAAPRTVEPTALEEILSVDDGVTGEATDFALALPADYQVLAADYLGR